MASSFHLKGYSFNPAQIRIIIQAVSHATHVMHCCELSRLSAECLTADSEQSFL